MVLLGKWKVAHRRFLPLAKAPSRQEGLLHRERLGASSDSRRTRRGMSPERYRAEASRRGGTGQHEGDTSAGHDNLGDDEEGCKMDEPFANS